MNDITKRYKAALLRSISLLSGGPTKTVTYGKARIFKTEGDVYEAITGRRSKVIDEADKRREKK